MGLCGALSDLDERGCPAAAIRPARAVQRAALAGPPRRRAVAVAANQFPALRSRLSADTTMASRRVF